MFARARVCAHIHVPLEKNLNVKRRIFITIQYNNNIVYAHAHTHPTCLRTKRLAVGNVALLFAGYILQLIIRRTEVRAK